MRDLASVEKITKLSPIEGADKIEVASILGWEVIVQKGEFKVGDLAVYCEYDTILPPKPEFEFLRPRCYSKAYDGFRIKNMKLRGVYSQGIVFPTNILPKDFKFKEGTNVAGVLGIRRYDPEELKEKSSNSKKKNIFHRFLMKYPWYRNLWKKKTDNSYPNNLPKSDETNIQKVFDHFCKLGDIEFYITEKLEGQSASYTLYKDKFDRYSHNVKLKPKSPGSWCKVEEQYGIEKILRQLKKEYKKEYALQGEIVGPNIQQNIYDLPTYEFFIFRVKNLTDDKFLEFEDLKLFMKKLKVLAGVYDVPAIKMVPVLETRKGIMGSVEELLAHSEKEKSVLNPKVMREGVVWRSTLDQTVGFKVKSPKYDIWFNKKEETV